MELTSKTSLLRKGMKVKCIKDFYMGDGELDYIAGKSYKCEQDGCLTDEQGCKDHQFSTGYCESLLKEYFAI